MENMKRDDKVGRGVGSVDEKKDVNGDGEKR